MGGIQIMRVTMPHSSGMNLVNGEISPPAFDSKNSPLIGKPSLGSPISALFRENTG